MLARFGRKSVFSVATLVAVVLSVVMTIAAAGIAPVWAASGPPATVNVAALNVRQGPGTNYAAFDVLHAGDTATVTGRDAGSTWYQVTLTNGSTGWISAAYATLSGNAASLPVAQAPAPPAAPPAAAAPGSGRTVVFQVSSGGPIYVATLDPAGNFTGSLRYLTTGIDPALSPDGRTVAFTRWEQGGGNGSLGSVWLINIDGTGERKILANVAQPKSPTWSPDSQQLIISMQQGGTLTDQLTNICRPFDKGSDIPSNMQKVGDKVCLVIPANPEWGLRSIDPATGAFKDLPRDLHSFAPTWDPTVPARIVFKGDHGLQSVDLNAGTTTPLTNNPDDRGPVFSPDGTRIAVTFRQNDHWEIHVMNADGSGDTRLTETPATAIADQLIKGQNPVSWNNAAPAWSPDGSKIAFLSDRNGAWEIWVMNVDGSNQHVLIPASALKGQAIQYAGVDERVISWR